MKAGGGMQIVKWVKIQFWHYLIICVCWSNTIKVPLYQPSSSSESHWSQRWRQLDKVSPDLRSQPPQSEKWRQSERHLAQHDEIGMDMSGWWNKKESKQVLFPAFLALTSLAGSIIPDTSLVRWTGHWLAKALIVHKFRLSFLLQPFQSTGVPYSPGSAGVVGKFSWRLGENL